MLSVTAYIKGRSNSNKVAAYHGLARGVVSVTSAAALPAIERALLAQIDLHTQLVGLDGVLASDTIVVKASSPGLPTAAMAGKPVRFRWNHYSNHHHAVPAQQLMRS